MHQRTVDRVIRNIDGYFYLFMNEAIQRFDGKNFEYVNVDELTSAGIKPMDITSINLLENGDISITVNQNKHHFIIQKNRLKAIKINAKGKTQHGDNALFDIVQEENVFDVYQFNLGLLPQSKANKVLTLDLSPKRIIQHGDETFYIQDENDRLYFIKNKIAKQLKINGNIIKSNNSIYVWTTKAVYKATESFVSKVQDFPYPRTTLTQLKKDYSGNTIATYTDSPNFQDQIYVLTKKEKLFDFKSIIDYTRLFKDFWTDDVFYKWMLVGHTNIKIVSLLRDGAQIVKHNPAAKKGSFGSIITGVASDKKGNIYFTKETEGFYKLQDSSKYSEVYDSETVSKKLYNNGKFYYSPYDDHFYNYCFRYDGTTQLVKYKPNQRKLFESTIPFKLNDFLPIDKDNIIVGGYLQGKHDGKIGIYNHKTNKTKELYTYAHRVRSIYKHPESKQYWIGTMKGVNIYDENWNKIDSLSSRGSKTELKHIESEDIIMINSYRDKIIMGTLGGIYIVDPKSITVEKHIHRLNGLSNNMAIGIMPDNLGNCWISTFNGMNIMDSTFTIFKKIYDHQGLPEREFNSKAIAKDENGFIYAGTTNGLAVFDPEKVLTWKESYGLAIEKVEGHWDSKSEIIDISGQKSFYNDLDSITISYINPDYYNYPFTDRKVDIQSNSIPSTHINKTHGILSLINIPNGATGITLTNPATNKSTNILLKAKSDFRKMFIGIGILLAMGLISYFIIRYNKKKAEEKAILKGKISELQLTSLQSQMNPHFIFNALGAIQYFIQTHDSEKADEYLSNFAMLMRHILESSKSKYVTMKQEIETLKLYVGLEQVRFENIFNYEFDIDDDLATDLRIPPMILQPYIENAINHGLYNLKDRFGKLTLKFEQVNEDIIRVTISDNGVGRAKAAELRNKRHKSRGMQIVNERINTINSSDELDIKIEIKDLMKNSSPSGTEVIVLIHDKV